ncbi:MAG: aspartate kinase [Oscillospiraceae bacterium]|nr:aspartate kinase [Oscillospiraceae bacterium]
MLKVAKFGGSSVAGAEQFKKVKAIVEADDARRLVVVSAAGKRSSDDHKLTDLLYLCHAHLTYGVSCGDILHTIEQRFIEIRDELGLTYPIEEDLKALEGRLSKDMSVDELVSRGEYFTSRLMAEYLGFAFVDAADCIFFGFDGQVDRERTDAAIAAALEQHGRVVLPGFYGRLPTGRIKVMTRGGSDITGALAAAAVNADVYENWTDVSGILMADPRIVENPSPIASITYSELRELAFMGASVLHEESVLPVKERGIALNIRNTNRPDDPGTMIVESVEEEAGDQERFITGIAGRRNFTILTVSKRNMNQSVPLRQSLEILDRYKVPVEHITLGLDSFALVASTAALGDSLFDVIADIRKACRPDDVQIQDGIALVAAVGRKMPFRPGVSGRLFQALGNHGVNIRTIAQGADEISIIVGVENEQFETAIRVMYDGFADKMGGLTA